MKNFKFIYFIFNISFLIFFSNKDIAGNNIISNLTCPPNFSISVFCEDLVSPWMMTFDSDENLIVTVPKRGAVIALPDRDGNGRADKVYNVITGLDSPSGIEMSKDNLYTVTRWSIIKAPYNQITMKVRDEEAFYYNFPVDKDAAWYRTIKFGPDKKLFLSITAPCDACKPMDDRFGSILELNENGKMEKIYAMGFRQMIGLAYNPKTKNFFGTDICRDNLDGKYAFDELNLIKQKGFYGWPYCYGDGSLDPVFNQADFCRDQIKPQFKLPYGSMPYGLAFYNGNLFPSEYKGDLFIALHGKENNKTGFKIIRVIMEKDKPVKIKDFITGWLTSDNKIIGQPVDIAINKKGEMFITDDYSGKIYKVVYNK